MAGTQHELSVTEALAELARRGRHPIAGGADPVEPPGEFAGLDEEQLQARLDEELAAFDELANGASVTDAQLAEMREITARVEAIRAEQQVRLDAAQAAQAEIDEMAGRVRAGGEEPPAEDPPAEDPPAETPPVEGEGGDPTTDLPVEDPQAIAAAGGAGRRMNLARIRERQPRVPQPRAAGRRTVTITASADVPGIDTGSELDMANLTEAVMARARGIKTKGGKRNTALVAAYAFPFEESVVVDDDGSYAAGMAALTAAADQSRLPVPGDLVASGGWCAPSETIYDIADFACPDLLWSPPETQLRRGGVRFFVTPTLDVDDLAHEWTEADDQAADPDDPDTFKECFAVPCPEPEDVRCAAIYACVEAGILTERAFPELVSWYTRNTMVAHEIVVKRKMFLAAVNHARTKQITVDPTFAALSAVYGAVALEVADFVERHSMCESTGVEVAFPWWARNLFLADLARQNGTSLADVDPQLIVNAFANLGATISFARGLAPNVPTNIGGSGVALGWPDSVPFLLYPAGGFQIGRGDTVDLGVVQDSNKFKTNDFTALWTEECVALIARGPEARFVIVPVCPNGTTGAQDPDVDCSSPIDGGPAESS